MSYLIPCAGEAVNIDTEGCECIVPEGTLAITENGTHNVRQYESAEVAVPLPQTYSGTYSVTPTKSTQTLLTNGKAMENDVTVNPIPDEYIVPEGSQSITENGTYDVTALSEAVVDVQGGGGGGYTADDIAMRSISGRVEGSVATHIGVYAFDSCYYITGASFPNVTTVGSSAFRNCSRLTDVYLPRAQTVFQYAFRSCTALSSIDLPAVTSIISNTFNGCTALKTLSLTGIKIIPANFCLTMSLETVVLSAISSIESYAFRSCYHLTTLDLTGISSAVTIGRYALESTPLAGYSASAGRVGSIYVPSSLYSTFTATTGWSGFLDRIVSV